MIYQMEVEGMHCPSCKNLIVMDLEDRGLEGIKIDMMGNRAQFSTDLPLEEVDKLVAQSQKDLGKYRFFNLQTV